MARAAIAAAAIAAGCAGRSDAITVVRTGDDLTVHAPGVALDVTWTRPDVLTVALDTGTALRFTLAPGPLGWTSPRGQLAGLQLTWPSDGPSGWIGELDGASYRLWLPEDRAALAGALDGELGDALRAVLPYHRYARAWLPESRAAFAAAALADATTTQDPASWPVITTELALDPPGLLPGDRPGLGMTCSTAIQCPPDAPICVTPSHQQARGYCTRACLEDRECDGDLGRCGLDIRDIPGVPGGVTGCYLPCGADGSCPALLACSADLAQCAPP